VAGFCAVLASEIAMIGNKQNNLQRNALFQKPRPEEP